MENTVKDRILWSSEAMPKELTSKFIPDGIPQKMSQPLCSISLEKRRSISATFAELCAKVLKSHKAYKLHNDDWTIQRSITETKEIMLGLVKHLNST